MNLLKAKTALDFSQYKCVLKYFKKYLDEEPHMPVSLDDLNMLEEAYKCVSDEKRSIIRELGEYLGTLEESDENYANAAYSMQNDLKNDLNTICTEIIDIIDSKLLKQVIEMREKALVYKMKGDYYRYQWEINHDEKACQEANKAYYEAISICKWNFEPIDSLFLQVAMNYSVQLNNANKLNEAVILLKETIKNAKEYIEKNDMNSNYVIESLITDLQENLRIFLDIINRNIDVETIEEPEHRPVELATETDILKQG